MVAKKHKRKKTPCDNSLVKRVKSTGCNPSFIELMKRHENLYYKMCQRYMPVILTKGLSREDILKDKEFVIFKAIKSYKPNKKTKFSTWLGNCSKYHCLTFINKNNKYVNMEDEVLNSFFTEKSKEDYDSEENLKHDKDFVFKILNELKDQRISKVFRLRYFDKNIEDEKATWSIIARKMNTSTQTAINLHQRGVNILSRKLKSKEIHDSI